MISVTSFKSLLKKNPPFHKIKLVSALISFLQKQAPYKMGELSIKKMHIENI